MLDHKEQAEETIGERIEIARTAGGLSIAQLSRRMSVQVKTVKNWLQNQSKPRANQLTMLAGILGVPVLWILHGTKFEGETSFHEMIRMDLMKDKIERLLSSHQEIAILIMELQQDFNSLQKQLDQERERNQIALKKAPVR